MRWKKAYKQSKKHRSVANYVKLWKHKRTARGVVNDDTDDSTPIDNVSRRTEECSSAD